ncbi:MAG: hypothetical protein IT449_09705 [Phycisphaerales bacterium]|nr:hypothetical protein [Phycisphaerales bacterium]
MFLDQASAPDLVRLRDGRIMAMFDVHSQDRSSIWVTFSRDEGRSWDAPHPARIQSTAGSLELPRHADAVVSPGGAIKIFFTTGPVHRDTQPSGESAEAPIQNRSHEAGVSDSEGGAQPAPAETDGGPAPGQTEGGDKPAPAGGTGVQPVSGAAGAAQVIRGAVSRDGIHFVLDPQVEMKIAAPRGEMHVMTALFRDRVFAYVDAPASTSSPSDAKSPALLGFLSRDGRRFARFSPKRPDDVHLVGDLLARGETLTGCFCDAGRMRLFESNDARTFAETSCKGPPGATDAALTVLKGAGLLMLYAAPREGARASVVDGLLSVSQEERRRACAAHELAEDGSDARAARQSAGEPVGADTISPHEFVLVASAPVEGRSDGASRLPRQTSTIAGGSTAGPGEPTGGDITSQSASASVAGAPGRAATGRPGDSGIADPASLGSTRPEAAPSEAAVKNAGDQDAPALLEASSPWPDPYSTFAPTPTFREWVDYATWYRTIGRGATADDANIAYMQVMPAANDPPGSKPDWPELVNMFSDGTTFAHPAPWAPEDHPDWEASYQQTHWLADWFRQATLHTGYAGPDLPPPDDATTHPEEEAREQSLLINILLPGLSSHRAMAKKLISDSWRAEGGRVDPARMTQAWETVLRGAGHMQMGSTLIEELVGVAEQSLVQENARWALDQGVFQTEEEIEGALNTLESFDRCDRDPVQSIRGEHAMAMDSIQYMFWPGEQNGEPKPIPDRIEKFSSLIGEGSEEPGKSISEMTAPQVYETIDGFDAHYRTLADQMRVGYPLVRAADLDAMQESFAAGNPMADMLLPSLSRYYKLRARSEASRRATQLSYAAHLYKAREGRWPASLDELPEPHRTRVRTDPFTGSDFGYQLTPDGPRVYSMSENGLDDGGMHAHRWDDGVEEGASDDYVFWPPQVRPQ